MRPFLRDEVPASFEKIPEATVFEAGYLVTKNAGWRNVRPVVDASKCKNCLQCYLYCPDGTIRADKENACVSIDYDFCKGCGICAKICKFGAIKMENER